MEIDLLPVCRDIIGFLVRFVSIMILVIETRILTFCKTLPVQSEVRVLFDRRAPRKIPVPSGPAKETHCGSQSG
jgi:hypothetical protein